MKIRTKLIMYFVSVALLAPILGMLALNRVRAINSNVQNLTDSAIPLSVLENQLGQSLLNQQAALNAFVLSGRAEDRQRYLDQGQAFDQALGELTAKDTTANGKDLAKRVSEQRAKFNNAGAQAIQARATQDRNRENLRTRRESMTRELNAIRTRFLPAGTSANDASAVPTTIRNQVNDLLLGTEGMLNQVAREASIVSDYTVAPDDALKKDFEVAGSSFNNWLQLAYGAGGAEDRQILVRVQTAFGEYESSARAMMAATDLSVTARRNFGEAATTTIASLDAYQKSLTANVNDARTSSSSTVDGAQSIISLITVIGFLFAGALGVWFAGTITRPLRQLRDVADRVSTGDLGNAEITFEREDEIGDLAIAFRRMVASVRFLMTHDADEDDDAAHDDLDFSHAAAS